MVSQGSAALDSWFTMGFATRKHVGILKELDDDGNATGIASLGEQDGMIEGFGNQVVMYNMNLHIVEKEGASVLYSKDCAWANLGGVSGPDPENRVLIAQLTTDGELSLELNVQMGGPDCEVVQFVSKNPQDDQILHEGLIYKGM